MVERMVSKQTGRKTRHTPHGLSREKRGGSAWPMIIGLVCAVAVLVVLWLAYTYG